MILIPLSLHCVQWDLYNIIETVVTYQINSLILYVTVNFVGCHDPDMSMIRFGLYKKKVESLFTIIWNLPKMFIENFR